MSSRTVAIIGAGIGSEHAAAYSSLPSRYTVSIVCDTNTARAQPIADTLPDCKVTASFQAVLNDPTIDIIDICLPPHLHFQFTMDALAAGKHVICEKPLVSSVKDADTLVAANEQSSGTLFPVFQYRYGPGATQMRALIDNNLTGKPYVGTLETHWNRDSVYYEPEWRGTWKGEQGGAVLGHAIHIHDWLNTICGPVASIYAELATRVNDIEVEDCAALTIRMQSGALVTSSITLGAANDTSRLRFCFEGLTAESGKKPYAPADDIWTFTARAPFTQADIDKTLASIASPSSSYAGLFTAIADALDGKPGNEVTLEDGRRSLEFVSAVYHSARTGKAVSMPLEKDHELYAGWLPG